MPDRRRRFWSWRRIPELPCPVCGDPNRNCFGQVTSACRSHYCTVSEPSPIREGVRHVAESVASLVVSTDQGAAADQFEAELLEYLTSLGVNLDTKD